MIFAAVSGSSPATVAAIGSIVIVGMVQAGYPKAMAAGVITNAGTLGILIPPSIVMLVYAAATEESAARLFMAGFVPGISDGRHADDRHLHRRPDQRLAGATLGRLQSIDALQCQRDLGSDADHHRPRVDLRRHLQPH